MRAGKRYTLRAGGPHVAAPAAERPIFDLSPLQQLREDPQFITASQACALLKQGCTNLLAVAVPTHTSPTDVQDDAVQTTTPTSSAPPTPLDFEAALPDTNDLPVDRAAMLDVLRSYEAVFQALPAGLPPDHGVGHTIRV
jgi:hypothetical protein